MNKLRLQKSDNNLKSVVNNKNGSAFEKFCNTPHELNHPLHHDNHFIQNKMNTRNDVILKAVMLQRALSTAHKIKESVKKAEIKEVKIRNDIDTAKLNEINTKPFKGRNM